MAPVPSTVVSLSLVTRRRARSSSISFSFLFRPVAVAAETMRSTTKNASVAASMGTNTLSGNGLLALAKAGCTSLTMMTLPSPHSSENCGQI